MVLPSVKQCSLQVATLVWEGPSFSRLKARQDRVLNENRFMLWLVWALDSRKGQVQIVEFSRVSGHSLILCGQTVTSELLYTLTQSNEKHQYTQSNWANLELTEYRSQTETQVLGPDCFMCGCRLPTHSAGTAESIRLSMWAMQHMGTGTEIVTITKNH